MNVCMAVTRNTHLGRGVQKRQNVMERPSLSRSPFPAVTLLRGSHERWVNRVARNAAGKVQLHFLVLTLILTGQLTLASYLIFLCLIG